MLIAVDGGAGRLMNELRGGDVRCGAFVATEGGVAAVAAPFLEGEASPGGETEREFVHGCFHGDVIDLWA